jgi:hypothetical protein
LEQLILLGIATPDGLRFQFFKTKNGGKMLNAVWQVKIGFKKPTGKRKRWKTKKPGRHRAFMMDGLVSTRKFLSLHNIKNNFSDIKNFSKIFYAHFIFICGKGL